MITHPKTQAISGFRAFWTLLLFLALAAASFQVRAAEEASGMEAWLITYGPGDLYWQSFGHNAIWIRDPDLGLNHVFNFGYFDFRQEAFFRRFLQGKLLYFSAAQKAEKEFSGYVNENRSIRAQRLNLSPAQSLRLADYLVAEVQPENRDYLYDYYTNNCSTRIRDALDEALDGTLSDRFKSLAAGQSWRDHTRRLSFENDWLYIGLETSLGARIDKASSQWDEFFIPSVLANAVGELTIPSADGEQALVLEDLMLFESDRPAAPAEPDRWWPRYLLVSVLVLFAAWLACKLLPWVTPIFLVRSWLVLAGLAGILIAYLWLFTDHTVARPNLNLLVFNPLWFLAGWRKYRQKTGILLLLLSLLAVVLMFVPPEQYNLDVLALFLPLNVAAGLVLLHFNIEAFRRRFRSEDPPDAPVAGGR